MSMSREFKKEMEGNPSKKKRKFYRSLEVLEDEFSTPKKKLNFEAVDIEMLIGYYQSNPAM